MTASIKNELLEIKIRTEIISYCSVAKIPLLPRAIIFLCCILFFITTQAQSLQSYISQALINSPKTHAYALRYDIAQEKIREAGALPNTELSAGYFASEPETRVGAQRARFSVRQQLPWFGSITARENYASLMAEAEYVELAIIKRKLSLEVAQNYYELYALKAKQKILGQDIHLLKTYERLTLTAVAVGNASAVDVLRLQMKQNELQQQLEMLEEDFIAKQIAFNNLINIPEMQQVSIVDTLIFPEQDRLDLNDKDLLPHPELLKYDKLYESVAQAEALNRKEGAPGLGFGLDYIPVTERTDMNPMDNGKDILMPMISLSIPIFNAKYNSVTKQNQLQEREITAQKQERYNALRSAFAKALSERNKARILFETQQKNLDRASDAGEILLKNYETASANFKEVLDIEDLKLTFKMNQIEAIQNYYLQQAFINYLTD